MAGLGLAMAGAAVGTETNRVASAMEAFRSGRNQEALRIVELGIKEQPKETRLYNVRAQIHQLTGQFEAAERDLTEAIGIEGNSGWLYQERAQLRFRLGRVEASVADFDRANELAPRMAPQNWQRGIALYYAGRFADGRRQFELHKTVNPDDVENAAWHFLCTAREQGIEKARAQLMPIRGDSRVPMAQIHELFAGKAKPKAVLDAADAGAGSAAVRVQRFYAHFYLALHAEANNDAEGVEDNLRMALILADMDNYMGVTAKVHADRLAAKRAAKTEAKP